MDMRELRNEFTRLTGHEFSEHPIPKKPKIGHKYRLTSRDGKISRSFIYLESIFDDINNEYIHVLAKVSVEAQFATPWDILIADGALIVEVWNTIKIKQLEGVMVGLLNDTETRALGERYIDWISGENNPNEFVGDENPSDPLIAEFHRYELNEANRFVE